MDDKAVSGNFAFIVASGILLASITGIYTATSELADEGSSRTAEQLVLQADARSLISQLLLTDGSVWDGASEQAWNASEAYTDAMLRMGLLEPGGDLLQFEKLHNLRKAGFDANDTDGEANYLEVIEDLEFDERGLGFHIRAKPALRSVEALLESGALKDEALRVSYIGDVESKTSGGGGGPPPSDEGLVVADLTCGNSPADTHSIRYSINITNGGTAPTQFFTVFDVYTDFQDGDDTETEHKISRQGQTFLVAAGATESAWVDFHYGPGAAGVSVGCDADDHVIVEVWDTTNLLRTEVLGEPNGSASPSTASGEFYSEIDAPHYGPSDTVTARYAGNLVATNDVIDFDVYKGTDIAAAPVYTDSDSAHNNANKWKFTFTEGDFSSTDANGEYTLVMAHEDGINATQQLLIASSVGAYAPPSGGPGPSTYDEGPSVRAEVEMVNKIMGRFCPFYYDQTSGPLSTETDSQNWNTRCSHFKDELASGQNPGDVYPDLKDELLSLVSQIEDPATGLPRYDYVNVIVVGSNVAHNSMTSGNFKWPLKAWVEGGGTLIVFGSPAKSTNWLNPIFGLKEGSSGSGLSTPDADHSLLTSPESLSYDMYETFGKGWEFTSGDPDTFTHVVKEGDVPITMISEPGKYGLGTIVLTTWLPYDLFGDGSQDEMQGLMLMNNFLMQGYQDLYVDYGPELPAGVPVLPAADFAEVYHPQLKQVVTLKFTVYVFPY